MSKVTWANTAKTVQTGSPSGLCTLNSIRLVVSDAYVSDSTPYRECVVNAPEANISDVAFTLADTVSDTAPLAPGDSLQLLDGGDLSDFNAVGYIKSDCIFIEYTT